MRHSPISGFSCFLRISLATSSVTTRGARLRARLVIQTLNAFLYPAFQRRVHRLFAHRQIRGDGSNRPSVSMELHNIVATLRRIRGVAEKREATHLDGWGRARGQHCLDRMMRGPPLKTSIADFCNLTDGHVWHFYAQVNDQLAHIWRQAPRRFLWLFSRPGSEEADHALLVKSVGFALQAGAWLTCLLCPLKSWIAEKYNRSQEFIGRLLREDACIAGWFASLRYALAERACALASRTPNTMR
jgi:hypothetical protein